MAKKTILIVDDIFENLYLLRVILVNAGYDVIEASNGQEGLEKLRKNANVNLIISDILMPVMDGYLFCQACKKDKLLSKIPFVFYTSTYTEKLDEDFALKLGAENFLRKPVVHDDVLNALDTIFKTKKIKKIEPSSDSISEGEVLKLYSERLINKLEQKSLDLGNEVAVRKKAQQLLIQENQVLDLIAQNRPLKVIFEKLLLSYEAIHPNYYGSICLLDEAGTHLKLQAAPSMPPEYNAMVDSCPVMGTRGSCGAAVFTKKPVIVSDIANDKLWDIDRELALKYNLKSCWSVPILTKNNKVLGTFAIYSESVNTPTLDQVNALDFAVNLSKIAIDRLKAAAEIKKKDESYKALFNQANDAIVTYSVNGTIHSFNRAAYKNLGYTKAEFSKLKIQDFSIGDLIQNPIRHKKLLDGNAITFPRKFLRKDKSILHVEVSAKLQKDGKILGIARDVSEWLKNLEEIRREKEFSSGVLKSMQEGLYVKNLDSQIISVNPSFCLMTGFSEEELIGAKRPYPFSPPELASENENRYKLLLKNKTSRNFENTYMHKNGRRFPVQVIVSTLFDSKGAKTAIFATVQDISERKKSANDLKRAKEFTDKLIMSMQEGLIIARLDTKIIMANEAFTKITGYTQEEIMHQPHPYPFWRKEDHDSVLKNYSEVALGRSNELYYDIVKKNGDVIKASFFTGNIKDDKGDVIALYATIKDVSEEEKLKHVLKEKASRANQKKEVIMELAGLIGEDFNASLKRIAEASAKAIGVAFVTIWEYNDDKTELLSKLYYDRFKGEFEEDRNTITQKEFPEYFKAFDENASINIINVVNSSITKSLAKQAFISTNVLARVDVVVHGRHGNYGIMSFECISPNRVFTSEEEGFATSIASMVSLMVESRKRKLAEHEILKSNALLVKANMELNTLRNQLERENIYLRNELDLVFNYEDMVYGSAEFSHVLTEVEQVAPTDATVLLLGESGTGKELLARAVHNTSFRNKKPLIKINCSPIPRELIESELFGHVKGSFTGAYSDKIGKLELADGGTLFLDEIGELPLDMQPKILRFLQEGEIEVVGGNRMKKLNVRVIAATNRNLIEEVEKKQFRQDLYFRLNVFPINVPPLRERRDDIPLLVEHFVDKFNKSYDKSIKYISDGAMNQLKSYNWPGNIRELENLIERASILSNDETLVIPGFESETQKNKQPINNVDLTFNAVQRNHILQVLEQCNWKIGGIKGAASVLDLKPSTLRDKMKKLGIVKPA